MKFTHILLAGLGLVAISGVLKGVSSGTSQTSSATPTKFVDTTTTTNTASTKNTTNYVATNQSAVDKLVNLANRYGPNSLSATNDPFLVTVHSGGEEFIAFTSKKGASKEDINKSRVSNIQQMAALDPSIKNTVSYKKAQEKYGF